MKRAVPKLSLTGPRGPPRHGATSIAEGRLFCPKLSYTLKDTEHSRPHPLNAHPINVIEPHGLEDARPESRESERVKLTCLSPYLFPQITTASSSHPDNTAASQSPRAHDDLRAESRAEGEAREAGEGKFQTA